MVALGLRAWAPVFASLEVVLGPSGLYGRMIPDWEASQSVAIAQACATRPAWVAEVGTRVVGFVALDLDREADEDAGRAPRAGGTAGGEGPEADGPGGIHMVAVDPAHQRRGHGRALTEHACAELRERGFRIAMVETGGDPGHASARRTYEAAGFTALPITRYFRTLR